VQIIFSEHLDWVGDAGLALRCVFYPEEFRSGSRSALGIGFPWKILEGVMSEQTGTGPLVDGRAKRPRRKGSYKISGRMLVALEALASGGASSLREAAEVSGLTERALQYAVRKESVRSWLREHVRTQLALGQLPAVKTMLSLLRSENSMSQFRSASWLMAVNGVAPPSAPTVAVNIGPATGYLVDLRKDADRDSPLTERDQAEVDAVRSGQAAGAVLLGARGEGGPVIEHDARRPAIERGE
jgi:hypothetical protein